MVWNVAIITEGSPMIGFGHIVRCSAIGDEFFKRGCDVSYLINGNKLDIPLNPIRKVQLENWLDIDVFLCFLEKNKPDIIVIDSYLANENHYKLAYEHCSSLFIIDDTNRLNYFGGNVINPSFYGEFLNYPVNENITYGLGSSYVIVRDAFKDIDRVKEIKKEISDVLIIFGGTDILNYTPATIEMVEKIWPSAKLHIVSSKPNYNSMNQNIYFYSNLNGEMIKELMLKCDLAISASGQTIYELIATNTPFLAVKVAENQTNNIKYLEKMGLAISIEKIENLNKACSEIEKFKVRRNIYERQKEFKFTGTEKIVTEALSASLRIRNVNKNDIRNIYDLSNDYEVRRWSINSKSIIYENHIQWFEKVISDESIYYQVIESKRNKVFLGQIRIEKKGEYGLISISFKEELRGKRLASKILDRVINEFLTCSPFCECLIAKVHKKNTASIRLFESLDFNCIEEKQDFLQYKLLITRSN